MTSGRAPGASPRADIASRVRELVAGQVLLDGHARVSGDAPLLNGLIDSTGLMELLSLLEDEFGVSLDYGDIDEENFGSLDRIAAFVERKAPEIRG